MPRPVYIPSTARTVGRRIRPEQQQVLTENLPDLRITADAEALAVLVNGRELVVEIGYGGGEHLIHRAGQQPEVLFLGCEVYLHGVAGCVKDGVERGIENVRLFTEDARLLLDALPPASVSKLYILFPDPWPKVRHHKRRLINPATLELFHRVLKPGGVLQLASDHPDYAAWMLAHLLRHPGFTWTATRKEDWQIPPEGHIRTRYEEKCKANHPSAFFTWIKIQP